MSLSVAFTLTGANFENCFTLLINDFASAFIVFV